MSSICRKASPCQSTKEAQDKPRRVEKLADFLPVVAVDALGNPTSPTVLDGLGGADLHRHCRCASPVLFFVSGPSERVERVMINASVCLADGETNDKKTAAHGTTPV